MKRLGYFVGVLSISLLLKDAHGGAVRKPSETPFPDLGNATIHREALPQPPAGKKISWLLHRGGWGDAPTYGTRFDLNHYDEFLDDYSSGLEAEFTKLSELGDAAFIQDFGNVGKLAAAAGKSGMAYAVINTLSPLALSAIGVKTPEDFVGYLVRQLSTRDEFPGYYNIDGKPIVFMFNVSAFDKAGWQNILRETRKAYPNDDLRFIAQRSVYDVLSQPDPLAYMKEVLEAFDGIMFWGGPQDVKLENLDLARTAIESIGEDRLVFWVITDGYWRLEKGMFMDPRGTTVWRDQLEVCFQNEFDGLIIEAWNDFEENTDEAPSRENGGIFFELLKYYSAISNQRDYAATDPGLLLAHPRDVLLGEVLDVEVISLPVKTPRKAFQLQIEDPHGQVVYRSPEQPVAETSAEVFTFSFPTRKWAESDRLVYKVVVDGRVLETGTWTMVRKSKLKSPWVRGVVLSQIIQSENIAVDLRPEGGKIKADISIQHDTPLARVDIYCNDEAVWSLDAERLNRKWEWRHAPVVIDVDFQMPKASYANENNNRSAVLTVANGALVRGFDTLGRSLVAAPDRAKWDAPAGLGRQFNARLLVDADDNTLFTIKFSVFEQTIEFTLGELRSQKLLERKTSSHGRVWIREINHPMVWRNEPGGLGTKVAETISLSSAGGLFENEYYLWVMDQEGKTFRSQPVAVYSETRENEKTKWFWDAESNTRFPASVSGNEQIELAWSFDGVESRIYEDEHGFGAWLKLGGGMIRACHFNPDALPLPVDRKSGRALRFDGKDYVKIDAAAFPQGAFEMELDVCPEELSASRQTLYFCRSNLTLFFTPDGRIGATFQGLENLSKPIELINPIHLPLNEWAEVALKYDYQRLVLSVNGQEISIPLANGPARRPSAESYLGAKVGGTQGTYANGFFTGKLDNLKIRCGALVEE